jgi:hypothetical protein
MGSWTILWLPNTRWRCRPRRIIMESSRTWNSRRNRREDQTGKSCALICLAKYTGNPSWLIPGKTDMPSLAEETHPFRKVSAVVKPHKYREGDGKETNLLPSRIVSYYRLKSLIQHGWIDDDAKMCCPNIRALFKIIISSRVSQLWATWANVSKMSEQLWVHNSKSIQTCRPTTYYAQFMSPIKFCRHNMHMYLLYKRALTSSPACLILLHIDIVNIYAYQFVFDTCLCQFSSCSKSKSTFLTSISKTLLGIWWSSQYILEL